MPIVNHDSDPRMTRPAVSIGPRRWSGGWRLERGCGIFLFSCWSGARSASGWAAVRRPREGLLPLDQVHVVALDPLHHPLPVVQPLPGLDDVAVHVRQILHPVEDERRRDPLAGARRRAPGALQFIGDVDDFFDLVIHGVCSLSGWCLPALTSIARRAVKGLITHAGRGQTARCRLTGTGLEPGIDV